MTHDAAADDPQPQATDDLDVLIARARAGDHEVMPQLRALLDDHPTAWQAAGDIAGIARESWIGLIAGVDLATRESLARSAAVLEADLAGPAASSLEKLLVDRVVACWLQVHYSDAAIAQATEISLRQAAFAQKRQNAAHRRYLSAIGALAMVRRLVPAAVAPQREASAKVPRTTEIDPVSPAPLAVFTPAAGQSPVDEPVVNPVVTKPNRRPRPTPTRIGSVT